jgi:hypothetical protein
MMMTLLLVHAQVMRIQVQALGKTAAMFRPREAVVQRLLKKEDDGVYVVLFSSVDTYDARTALAHEGALLALRWRHLLVLALRTLGFNQPSICACSTVIMVDCHALCLA